MSVSVDPNGTIALVNDLDSRSVVDLTAEVREEANFHRFSYMPSWADGHGSRLESRQTHSVAHAAAGRTAIPIVVASSATVTTRCTLHMAAKVARQLRRR